MSKNIIVELRSAYPYLSPVEKRITDLILRDPREFVALSTAELSYRAEVSQGSINNFAKKYAGSGFSALKLRVAGCLQEVEAEKTFSLANPDGTVKSAMAKKIDSTMTAFYNTLQINDEQAFQNAVDLILHAGKVQVYGVYYSGIAANDFCYHLLQIGIPASFVSDMLMCAVSALMMDTHGVMVAISASGRTKEILDAAEIAKEKGARVIGLTSDKFSPLASLADVVLLSASGKKSVTDSVDETRLSQLLVLDTLCAYLRGKTEGGNTENYYRLKQIVNSHSIVD